MTVPAALQPRGAVRQRVDGLVHLGKSPFFDVSPEVGYHGITAWIDRRRDATLPHRYGHPCVEYLLGAFEALPASADGLESEIAILHPDFRKCLGHVSPVLDRKQWHHKVTNFVVKPDTCEISSLPVPEEFNDGNPVTLKRQLPFSRRRGDTEVRYVSFELRRYAGPDLGRRFRCGKSGRGGKGEG